MLHGAAVIRYEGKRSANWQIKYRDATGGQVKETLGPEPKWNKAKAERELGKRLAAVEEGYRKPDKLTFAQFTVRFQEEYLPGRNLKPTTLENYCYILERHLLPQLGRRKLSELAARPELIALREDHPQPPLAAEPDAATRNRLEADPHQPRRQHRSATPRPARDEHPERG